MSPKLARPFTEAKLIIASHNQGKVREMADLLAPFGIETLPVADLGLAEPEETGMSFAENAVIKARAAAIHAGRPALSDDSGLCVGALGNAPGIYSARLAGKTRDFSQAMVRIEEGLRAVGALGPNQRRARFVCALALAWPDGHAEVFQGEVAGSLVFPPRGTKGFGYDPIFVPDGHSETFGEMDAAKKHKLSHRAQAFAQLAAACFGPLGS